MQSFISFIRSIPSRLTSIDRSVTESIHESFWNTASLESRNGYRSQKTSEMVDSLAREIAEQIEKNEVELCEFEQDDAQPGHIVADALADKIALRNRGDEELGTTIWVGSTELFPRCVTFTAETHDGYDLRVEAVMSGFQTVMSKGRRIAMVGYTVREIEIISEPSLEPMSSVFAD